MVKPIIEGKVVKRKTISFDEEVFDKINSDREQVGFSTFINKHFREIYGLNGSSKKEKTKKTTKKL